MNLAKVDNPDMANFIKYPKLYSYIVGIWPAKKIYWYTYYFYRLRCLILLDFMIYSSVVGTTIQFYYVANSLETAFQSGFLFIFAWSAAIKYFNYTYKRQQIWNILKNLDNPIFVPKFEKQNKLIKNWSNFAQYYCKAYAICVLIGVAFFLLFPVLDRNSSRKYPVDMWFPFDVNKSKIYFAFTYFIASMGVITMGALNVCIDTLVCVLMNISTAQIQVLKDTLENAIKYACLDDGNTLRTSKDNDEVLVEVLSAEQETNLIVILNRCIEHHDAINKLITDLENVFSIGIFAQFLANTLVLCMNAVQIRMIPIKSFQFLTLVEFSCDILIESSLYCFNGQFIQTESFTIMDSIYKMEWYRCSTPVKRMLFIMLEKAKSTHVVKAGGIFDLSVTTLINILQKTFSFYTIMSTLLDNITHD